MPHTPFSLYEIPDAPKKRFERALSLCAELGSSVSVELVELFGKTCSAKAELRQSGRGAEILVELPWDIIDTLDRGGSGTMRMMMAGHELIVPNVFLNRVGIPCRLSFNEYRSADAKLDEPVHLRKVIPVPNERHNDMHWLVEQTVFNHENGWSIALTCVKLGGVSIDLCWHGSDGGTFLILDAHAPICAGAFDEACHSIMVALAYLMGAFFPDTSYTLAYADLKMDAPIWVRRTAYGRIHETSYTPIWANAHAYLSRKPEVADRIHSTLRPLSTIEFSRLCSRVHGSPLFKAALIRIVESMSSSLVLLPSGLYVALEAITKLDMGGTAGRSTIAKPIRRKVRAALQAALLPFKDNVTPDEYQSMVNKLDNVASVTNKDRLSKPFAKAGATLTDEEKEALLKRDFYLHGSGDHEEGDDRQADLDAFYWGLRVYCLLAILILKPLGYDSRIVNYPKIHESVHGRTLEEEYFRSI
ncbi:MAG: hypothetical protein JST38_09795 [Bacteroidetes bacterium]|nr:hypothetical protein [Bacteroidota bacterium]